MKQVKIWVMVCEPNSTATVETFTADTIEDCVSNLQTYLDQHTQPGTRTTIVQSGYVESGAHHGV